MDKLLTTEMQAILRALQLVGSVIECDADGCHGDAKGELLLIRDVRSREASFHFGKKGTGKRGQSTFSK